LSSCPHSPFPSSSFCSSLFFYFWDNTRLLGITVVLVLSLAGGSCFLLWASVLILPSAARLTITKLRPQLSARPFFSGGPSDQRPDRDWNLRRSCVLQIVYVIIFPSLPRRLVPFPFSNPIPIPPYYPSSPPPLAG